MQAHDVNVRTIVWSGVALGGAVVLAVLGVFMLLRVWAMPPQGERLQGASVAAPGARLQSAPQPELAQERAAKQDRLDSIGWVDEANGIAHIPIADAMDLLAQSAAPAASAASAPKEAR
jgi:hypothetical protein